MQTRIVLYKTNARKIPINAKPQRPADSARLKPQPMCNLLVRLK